MSERRSSTARVYDRITSIYDLMEAPMKWMGGRSRRERMIAGARGEVLDGAPAGWPCQGPKPGSRRLSVAIPPPAGYSLLPPRTQ